MSFRPPIALRTLLSLWAGLCAWALAWELARLARTADPRYLVGAAVTGLPCVLAAVALRSRWRIEEAGIRVWALAGSRFCAWGAVRRIDRGRVSFTVETDGGPLSPRWIAPRDRERLLGAIVERAELVVVTGDLPWGVLGRYVRRSAVIPTSHVQRRPRGPSGS